MLHRVDIIIYLAQNKSSKMRAIIMIYSLKINYQDKIISIYIWSQSHLLRPPCQPVNT